MPRQIQVNESVAAHRRVYFHLVAPDGVTAVTTENGQQPQVSTNGAAWTNTGIGELVAIGNGRYYAELGISLISTVGTVLETRYKSNNTAECPGDSVEVVQYTTATIDVTESVQTATPIVHATKLRGFTKDIVITNVDDEAIIPLAGDKLRAYIGRISEIDAETLVGAKFSITSDADSAAGSYIRKNSPSSGFNRLRIDADDLDFPAGIYTLVVDFYDANDANEWKTCSRDSFILEDS